MKWDQGNTTFSTSEKHLPFDTSYDLVNPKTERSMRFHFSHSTGSEWDPATKWIYWNLEKCIKLEVSNDPEMTAKASEAYLSAKLRK